MSEIEKLREAIERERKKLNLLAEQGLLDETYRQSLVLDRLIEQYIDACEAE